MCKILPGGTGFEGVKWSWREAEAWHCDRPGKATSDSTAHWQWNPNMTTKADVAGRCGRELAWACRQAFCVVEGRAGEMEPFEAQTPLISKLRFQALNFSYC